MRWEVNFFGRYRASIPWASCVPAGDIEVKGEGPRCVYFRSLAPRAREPRCGPCLLGDASHLRPVSAADSGRKHSAMRDATRQQIPPLFWPQRESILVLPRPRGMPGVSRVQEQQLNDAPFLLSKKSGSNTDMKMSPAACLSLTPCAECQCPSSRQSPCPWADAVRSAICWSPSTSQQASTSATTPPSVSCTPPAPSPPACPARPPRPRTRTGTRSRAFARQYGHKLENGKRVGEKGGGGSHLHPQQRRHRPVVHGAPAAE